MAGKKPPLHVLALIAKATGHLAGGKSKPQVIPEATLMNRIKRRKKK